MKISAYKNRNIDEMHPHFAMRRNWALQAGAVTHLSLRQLGCQGHHPQAGPGSHSPPGVRGTGTLWTEEGPSWESMWAEQQVLSQLQHICWAFMLF